jgi:hypothetical protein
MVVDHPRGEKGERVVEPVLPVLNDPDGRRADAEIARGEQLRQEVGLGDVQALIGPEGFEPLMLGLGVVRVDRLYPRSFITRLAKCRV